MKLPCEICLLKVDLVLCCCCLVFFWKLLLLHPPYERVLLFCFEKVQCVELAGMDFLYCTTLGIDFLLHFLDPTVNLFDEKPKHTGYLTGRVVIIIS